MNEEEKKTIEKFIEKCYKYDENVEIKGISVGEEYRMLNTVCKALNLIEKLQKENGELREKVKQLEEENKTLNERNQYLVKYRAKLEKELYESNENYIPVSLVEEKIEEIQKEYEETLKTANFKEIEKMNNINFRGITLEGQRSILRELLEKR